MEQSFTLALLHSGMHMGAIIFVIIRGEPLGWEQKGSDGYELKVGLDILNHKKFLAMLSFGRRLIGEESIISNPYYPYDNYIKGPFPSGDYNSIYFMNNDFHWWLKDNISINSSLSLLESSKNGREFNLNIGIDIYYPIDISIKS